MVESNCGILCSKCKIKDEFNCKGCLKISNPFWGQCPIKKCIKEKNIDFCGACNKFPCQILIDFSYDNEQGDNGKRIEQCRCWNKI